MRGSLRLRLFVAGAASILLALALAGFGLVLLFEQHVERRITLELESNLRQLIDGLGQSPDGALALLRPPTEPRFQEPFGGLYWQIEVDSPAGRGAVLRSRSLWDTVLELPSGQPPLGLVREHTIPGPGDSSLLAVERRVVLPANFGGETVRVAVAMDRQELHAAGLAFARDLVPSLALLAVVLIVAAWVQVTIGLRPLGLLRRRLGAVRSGQEGRLGSAGFPDEVLPLAAEVDRLLDSRDAGLRRARARAADLAHGLRTPLTILAAAAARLKERGEGDVAEEIETVTEGMRRHIERELARARAAPGGPHQSAPAQVARQVVDVLRRTPRGEVLTWEIDLPAGLQVEADPQDLAEILGNLAENAMKWANHRVRMVGSRQTGGAVLLAVEDDGPGIANAEVATALARGGRLDATKPGAGLGLAIVGDLVDAYGGSLELGRSNALGGLRAEVRLPRGGPEPQAAR